MTSPSATTKRPAASVPDISVFHVDDVSLAAAATTVADADVETTHDYC